MILTARFVLVVNHVNTSNDDKYVLGSRLNYFLFSARLKILLPWRFQHQAEEWQEEASKVISSTT